MNLQGLSKVETADTYLDIAFARAKGEADESRESLVGTRSSKILRSQKIETAKLNTINRSLSAHLKHILKAFPNVDDLPVFYQELIKCTLEYSDFKHSVAAVDWANKKLLDFTRVYSSKISRTRDLESINRFRREYYGRISSVMKKLKKELAYLEECRKIMKTYPQIKTSLKSVAIVGFPNVGKTTLLYKLTGSKPEIDSYAFTTKNINVGILQSDVKHGMKKIQVLDTPGTLNRFDKMNNIEKQAYLVVRHLADIIVYVFDLTEPFPLSDQLKLYEEIKQSKKQILLHISKQDIIDASSVKNFEAVLNKEKHYSLDEIKDKIIEGLAEDN